jgi:hypothetical protein
MRSYLERTLHKKRAGGVAQGVDPQCKPQYCHKKKKLVLRKSTSILTTFIFRRQEEKMRG